MHLLEIVASTIAPDGDAYLLVRSSDGSVYEEWPHDAAAVRLMAGRDRVVAIGVRVPDAPPAAGIAGWSLTRLRIARAIAPTE